MEKYPKISIVSTFKDSRYMLKIIIESILSQDYPNVEYIVTDSVSKDGTVELLEEYTEKFKNRGYDLVWVSEPDKNLYEGYNKAIRLVTGEYLLITTNPFYNAAVLSLLMNNLLSEDYDLISGGCVYHKDGKVIRRWSGKGGSWRLGWMASTESICMKTKVIKKHGLMSEKYLCASDYDLQIKIFRDKTLKTKHLETPLVYYFAGGASNGGLKNNLHAIKESYAVLRDNKVWFAWFTLFCKCVTAFFAYTFVSKKDITHELKLLPGYEEEKS